MAGAVLLGRAEKPYVNPYVGGALLGVVLFLSFFLTWNGLGAFWAVSTATWFTRKIRARSNMLIAPHLLKMAGGDKNPLDDYLVFMTLGTLLGGLFRLAAWPIQVRDQQGSRRSPGARAGWMALVGGDHGYGARFARGCTSGQALSGGAVLSAELGSCSLSLWRLCAGLFRPAS